MQDLFTYATANLRGVGSKREKQLAKLGIHSVGQLLLHYPRSYIDLSKPYTISGAPAFEPCAIRATVEKKSGEIRLSGGRKMYKVTAQDETGVLEITFFNTPYAVDKLKVDEEYLFYGRAEGGLTRRTMASPAVYPAEPDAPYIAVYPLTKDLSNHMLAKLVSDALPLAKDMPDVLPQEVCAQFDLMDAAQAITEIHKPQSMDTVQAARRRLIFEELFTLAAGMGVLRSLTKSAQGQAMQPHSLQPFYDALPFTLTGAQQRAITDLVEDLCKSTPANRLVQGDVGSGKTMVAAAGAYFTFLNGMQSAIMAPTELLAQQHFDGLRPLLSQFGMRVELLTGSMSAAAKRKIHARLESGEIDLCIGTHALLSEGVKFKNLTFVVTDEQHRFGVAQRASLQQKGVYPHTLVMSATPIPRTLALVVYGELDVSIIDELPAGRRPIKTYKISSPKREGAFGFIHEHLDRGLQAYIVCPLVEAGEETEGLQAATDYATTLQERYFKAYRVGLLHGRMKGSEKEAVMRGFQSGEIQLLISTTVVEVGVDVPNAVIMLIENAERFGISQLHQLRGRVGRGQEQSHCFLLSDTQSEATLERLKFLCSTTDGFALAEYDLRTRGPGNFLGSRQHGLPELRIADLSQDVGLVQEAQHAANEVILRDPALTLPEHAALSQAVRRMLTAIGDRPN